jgi:hypothetical protein
MQQKVLLSRHEDIHKVCLEDRFRFTRSVLEALGLPIGEVWKNDVPTVEEKVLVRNMISNYQIFVSDMGDGVVKIYATETAENGAKPVHTLVAEWKAPSFILKEDKTNIDPDKRLYIEMTQDFWTIFD